MLRRQRQNDYLTKRREAIVAHVRAFATSKDPEELHRLRVETKKANALIALLRACSGNRDLSAHFAPVKTVFKHAGIIRGAHVDLQILRQHRLSTGAFTRAQEALLARESRRFSARARAYEACVKESFTAVQRDTHGIEMKRVLRACRKQVGKLGKTLSGPTDAGDLHECRKRVKNLLYLNAILPKALRRNLNLNTHYLHELQDMLGRWHDTASLLDLLPTAGPSGKKLAGGLSRQAQNLVGSIGALAKGFAQRAVLRS